MTSAAFASVSRRSVTSGFYISENEAVSSPIALPIDEYLPRIADLLRARRAVVVTAAPGAGKTTRVPPALVADGPVMLLEPRRVAARAIARRIADERGWTVGVEIGWHVRFDRQFSERTQLLVATEGVLTTRLQQDPLASAFRTIVLDEFHERSIHADLGLALARQAWLARPDLRLVVMSATMDSARVAAFLGDCPIIDVPGRVHLIEISNRPGVDADRAVADAWPQSAGSLLCFLPGAAEIRRTAERLAPRLAAPTAILPLHGSLSSEAQDAAIRPTTDRRVILATNVAETSLTVPGVTCVVDSGLHKVARYDPARAIDSLDVERISLDSADQRAGRAGRTASGTVVRLWDARDRLRPHREPDIARVDLASTVLDVAAWGGDPRTFAWFEAPPAAAIEAAIHLLRRLGAFDDDDRPTEIGRLLQRMPLPPRLGRILIGARGATAAARACAILSERGATIPAHQATTCDLLAAVDQPRDLPPHVAAVARELEGLARRVLGDSATDRVDDDEFRRAVLAAYPDRVARRRVPRTDSLVLSSGTGARLARESGVVEAEFLVAVEMRGTTAGPAGEPIVRIATGIERDWLMPTGSTIRHTFDRESGSVRAARLEQYDALVVRERTIAPDPEEVARLLGDEYIRRGPTDADSLLINRLRFAGVPASFDALVREATGGAVRLSDLHLERHLTADAQQRLARDAPRSVALPNGANVTVDYRADGRPMASVKLQRLIGATDTPRIGTHRVPLTFEILAPNGRPVQVTSDLASFWSTVYPGIRGALRARYPKHRWP
jgi:ATP-dependent helicase HrpB